MKLIYKIVFNQLLRSICVITYIFSAISFFYFNEKILGLILLAPSIIICLITILSMIYAVIKYRTIMNKIIKKENTLTIKYLSKQLKCSVYESFFIFLAIKKFHTVNYKEINWQTIEIKKS